MTIFYARLRKPWTRNKHAEQVYKVNTRHAEDKFPFACSKLLSFTWILGIYPANSTEIVYCHVAKVIINKVKILPYNFNV